METFPLDVVAKPLMDMLKEGMQTQKKVDNGPNASNEVFTVESYLSCCKRNWSIN
ncbi:hypothetical protein MU448_11475 [Streptococcus sp. O1]|uniref:hypothetical protein n=1 Tax=Streptococcus sp. O1 TaxID=2928735 RepID=UPI00211B185B|nr:hypothetical protein [Streptococcus sp. O1]MCQ9214963.1 hypothetical protein [Streptococcus sp. O1]